NYYANVQTKDGYEWSLWVEVKFHMNTPPPVPTTGVPTGTIAPSGTQTISWTAGGIDTEGSIITYYWYVDDNADFSSPVASGSTTSTTSSSFATNPSATYYCRVRANDTYEYSTANLDWSFSTGANTGNITGYVNDTTPGTPLPGATVSVPGYSTTTDSSGRYNLTGIPIGTYAVTASKVGYNSGVNPGVVVNFGQTTWSNFTLAVSAADFQILWVNYTNPVLTTQTINITVHVKNAGGSGTQTITVTISGTAYSEGKTKTLGPNEEKDIYFPDAGPYAKGTYTITASTPTSTKDSSLTVVEAPPAPTTSFAPPLIGIGIAVLVVAVLGTAVIWRKKKEKKKTKE
ncbi:MAG: carboxypeptidase-like regulatory domain-containing protein, partial [Thermoplasmatales archaeon]|nr:carboxypeptidase-like regulatory domain-containing protein [Thermoplasmatales archaeon]